MKYSLLTACENLQKAIADYHLALGNVCAGTIDPHDKVLEDLITMQAGLVKHEWMIENLLEKGALKQYDVEQ